MKDHKLTCTSRAGSNIWREVPVELQLRLPAKGLGPEQYYLLNCDSWNDLEINTKLSIFSSNITPFHYEKIKPICKRNFANDEISFTLRMDKMRPFVAIADIILLPCSGKIRKYPLQRKSCRTCWIQSSQSPTFAYLPSSHCYHRANDPCNALLTGTSSWIRIL